MLGRTYDREVCSAARALEIAGERWSLLILRQALFAGTTRFSDLQRSLGLAPNVLAARLAQFVADGVMIATPAESGHAEYHLTDKGRDFGPVVIALTEWGDRWAAPDGPPIVYEHEGCGGHVSLALRCGSCDEEIRPDAVTARRTDVTYPPRRARRRR
jgi:DNA-binding HxlR family transcriptional regulator